MLKSAKTAEEKFVLSTIFFFLSSVPVLYTNRNVTLSGNYSVNQPEVSVRNFRYSYSDTVNANMIKKIENPAFPFTQASIPAEPFFSSIYEPVIAVGAAALTVILFFTVRSK